MCFVCMMRRYNRIMIVCCGKTINKQNAQAVAFHCDHEIGFEEAQDWADDSFPNRVIIASSATLTAGDRGRRSARLVIVDECHRLGPEMAELLSYTRIMVLMLLGSLALPTQTRASRAELCEPVVNPTFDGR